MSEHAPTSTLRELDRAGCLARLAAGRFGRVVVALPSGAPVIRPVNYLFDQGSHSILISTRAGSKLFALLHAERATFEIDAVDHNSELGWSVIVSGVVEEVTHPAELNRIASLDTHSWAPHEEMRLLRIRAFTVTGREIDASAR